MSSSTLPLAPTAHAVGAGENAETVWPWVKPTKTAGEHPDARLGFDPIEVATARRRTSGASTP